MMEIYQICMIVDIQAMPIIHMKMQKLMVIWGNATNVLMYQNYVKLLLPYLWYSQYS